MCLPSERGTENEKDCHYFRKVLAKGSPNRNVLGVDWFPYWSRVRIHALRSTESPEAKDRAPGFMGVPFRPYSRWVVGIAQIR